MSKTIDRILIGFMLVVVYLSSVFVAYEVGKTHAKKENHLVPFLYAGSGKTHTMEIYEPNQLFDYKIQRIHVMNPGDHMPVVPQHNSIHTLECVIQSDDGVIELCN